MSGTTPSLQALRHPGNHPYGRGGLRTGAFKEMNLAFIGFLPPGSVNAEERTFVDLLSRSFSSTIVFQGIGVRGLGFHQVRSLPSRLMRRNLAVRAPGISGGLLPILPMRASWSSGLNAMLIRGRLRRMTSGAFQEWVLC